MLANFNPTACLVIYILLNVAVMAYLVKYRPYKESLLTYNDFLSELLITILFIGALVANAGHGDEIKLDFLISGIGLLVLFI